MHHSEIFFYSLIFFIGGIIIGDFFLWESFYLFCSLLLLFLGLLIFNRNRLIVYFLILIIAFILGWWRQIIATPNCFSPQNLCYYQGKNLDIVGKVVEVNEKTDSQSLKIIVLQLVGGIKISGKIQLITNLFPQYQVGDHLKINCQLQGLQNIKSPTLARYLISQGINSLCQNFVITKYYSKSFSIDNFWGYLKSFLSKRLNLTLTEPSASLMRGMILGDASGIPPFLKSRFADLGLTHIIAISGSHIAIICSVLLNCLVAVGVGRSKTFLLISLIIISYVILIGAPASAVRSAIMGLLILAAQKIGRLSRAKNILTLTAALMALENPKIILGDIGFQLSFAAVWGLIYLAPLIKNYFSFLPNFFQLSEIIITTCSAQLATLPLILFYFGRFSIISLLANLLILPIIPLLTILGLIQVISAGLSLTLGKIIGFPVWLICLYWLEVSQWLIKLPISQWRLEQFNIIGVVIFYLLIFILFVFLRKKSHNY